jgi:hypothetical protein
VSAILLNTILPNTTRGNLQVEMARVALVLRPTYGGSLTIIRASHETSDALMYADGDHVPPILSAKRLSSQ